MAWAELLPVLEKILIMALTEMFVLYTIILNYKNTNKNNADVSVEITAETKSFVWL